MFDANRVAIIAAALMLAGCGDSKDVAVAQCSLDAANAGQSGTDEKLYLRNCMVVAGYEKLPECGFDEYSSSRCWEPTTAATHIAEFWVDLFAKKKQ